MGAEEPNSEDERRARGDRAALLDHLVPLLNKDAN